MAYRADLFPHVLGELRSGRTSDELSEELNRLVCACRDTNKLGEITLTLKVKPNKGDNGQYFIQDTIKVKAPVFERGETLLYGTPEGNLQRTDPHRHSNELKSVSEDSAPLKQVNA